jgi:hypothetical protein
MRTRNKFISGHFDIGFSTFEEANNFNKNYLNTLSNKNGEAFADHFRDLHQKAFYCLEEIKPSFNYSLQEEI